MPEPALVLGLDLTCAPTHPTAYAVLDSRPALLKTGWLDSDDNILGLARQLDPCLIAIDAPLSLPLGLCCLREDCPCRPVSPDAGRSCERELARQGIGSFRTTKKTIIPGMVQRGMRLRQALEAQAREVIEVYPYATKVALWGKDAVRSWGKKVTRRGAACLAQHVRGLLLGVDAAIAANHDQCDAVLAAYTGYLYLRGGTLNMGDAAEGTIIVPRAPWLEGKEQRASNSR